MIFEDQNKLKKMNDFANEVAQKYVEEYLSSNNHFQNLYYYADIKYSLLTDMINICHSFGEELEYFILMILNKIYKTLNLETKDLIMVDIVNQVQANQKEYDEDYITYYKLTCFDWLHYRHILFLDATFPDYLDSTLYFQFKRLW